jgi:hypothetical protein
VVIEYGAGWFYRNEPARSDQESFAHRKKQSPAGAGLCSLCGRSNRYFGVPCTSTSTRRFGSRQAISALRSF